MTPKKLDELLEPIKNYLDKCREASKALEIFAPSSFICVDFASDLLNAYINAISREIGDYSKETWVEWFIWENDFGARGHECTVKGKVYIIENTADLLEVIEAWKKAQPKS